MKFFTMTNLFRNTLIVACVTISSATAATAASKAPDVLAPYLEVGKTVKGEVGTIVPPKEIRKYITKVEAAAKLNPEWHKKFAKDAKPGVPLPWHENLGLTKDEYEAYLKLWDQRQFKVVQQVVIRLEEPKLNEWMIRVSGVGMQVSLLRYSPAGDHFKSPNGELTRLEDISAEKRSILGEWNGHEWRYENKSEFISTKENIAIGKMVDGKYCLLIYRIHESTSGHRLADKSLVIRFIPPAK